MDKTNSSKNDSTPSASEKTRGGTGRKYKLRFTKLFKT